MKDTIKVDGTEYILMSKYNKLQKLKGKSFAEKDYVVLDNCNIMGLGKIQNFEDETNPLHLLNDFERDPKNVRLVVDLKENDVITVYKGEEKWARISKEYYDKAKDIINNFKGTPQLHIQNKKNMPVLIAGDDLGFVLAPRIEDEDR